MSGLFREHPPGLFVPAAALAALGYPAEQAAYAMNTVYQVVGIVLLQRLAAACLPGLESRALGWLIQLIPIAFTFRIRANHEAAVLLCLLAALYGTERARRDARFALLVAAAFAFLLLVKGLFALFAPLLCALWLLAGRRAGAARAPASSSSGRSDGGGERRAWSAIAFGVAASAAVALAFELAYRQASGEPFWSFYASRQLGVAATTEAGSGALRKLSNLAFYAGRLLWFAFPWSVAALVALRQKGRSRTEAEAQPGPAGHASAASAAWFAGAVVAVYLAVFSLADRRADRYVFPAYYALGAAGAVAALRLSPRLRAVAAHLDRPWVPAAVWTALFTAHLFAGRLGLPTVKL
jgi:hypothetical protein